MKRKSKEAVEVTVKLPNIEDSFKGRSSIGSKEHQRLTKILGQNSADTVGVNFGYLSVNRNTLLAEIIQRLRNEPEANTIEFRTLTYSSTYNHFKPFVEKAFGDDASFILGLMFHNK